MNIDSSCKCRVSSAEGVTILYIKDELTAARVSSENEIRKFECFLLVNSPASEFYMPTFRNIVCSRFIDGRYEE